MTSLSKQFTLNGELTSADMRKETPIYVDVPDGMTEIRFRFRFVPQAADDQRMPHQIRLMIFDTNGPRCEISMPDEAGIFMNAANASPGAVPGPVPAGRWMVFILVHRLLSDTPVKYGLEIDMYDGPIKETPQVWSPGNVAPRGPGWYRGDLHAHTIHSDGRWDVPDLVQFWKNRNADFMTLSDHNTISGLDQVRSLSSDDLLTMGGIELSTFFGHAVAVGAREWFDWRTLDGGQITMPELAQRVVDAGCLFTIAHPMLPGDPVCCGCRWEHYDMMPGNASTVEVWNGHWNAHNQEAVQWFYRWLNRGHRLTAVSGTDLHGPPSGTGLGALNVVYARELSEDGIIAAIGAGHSYLSSGPELILTASDPNGKEFMVGDTVGSSGKSPTVVTVRWGNCQDGDAIRFVVDGMVLREKIIGPDGELSWQLEAGQAAWCSAEVRDAGNGMRALTNPIYLDVQVPD